MPKAPQQPAEKNGSNSLPDLWCLHGNLQTEAVWRPFMDSFSISRGVMGGGKRPLRLRTVNLWRDRPESLESWTKTFCQRVRADRGGIRQFLMGYSLGGRIALHAAIADPSLWRGIVVMAGHPGIPDPEERERRIEVDRAWSARFLKEPRERVMADWDNQAIFQGRSSPRTPAGETPDHQSIAHWFERCSTGFQGNLLPRLTSSGPAPILYLTGEADRKYTDLGRSLAAACPCITHSVIPGAAHRVPWEASNAFIGEVQAFIAEHG